MPAASITDGLLVLVQLVMAAMTTAPCVMLDECPLSLTAAVLVNSPPDKPKPRSVTGAVSDLCQVAFMPASGTRSCGRLGPASDGSTVLRSSDTVLVNVGAGVASVRKSPCS